jgi:hypothetical protein
MARKGEEIWIEITALLVATKNMLLSHSQMLRK